MAHHNLWIALRGHGTLTLNDRTFAIRPGSVFLFRPGDRPVGREAPGSAGIANFAAHFHPHPRDHIWLERWKKSRNGARLRASLWLSPFLHELSRDFALPGTMRHGFFAHRLRTLLALLEHEPTETYLAPGDRRILEQIEDIRGDPANRRDVPDLAARCGMSPAQFTRRFRKLTGHPPNRFMIRERLNFAETLLRESTRTVAEIAESLGYTDTAFFSRQFARHRGRAPSALRSAP